MDSRTCVLCSQEKPISSIWYLMPEGAGTFVCGGCFSEAATDTPPLIHS